VGCFVGLFWVVLAIVGPLFSLFFWDFLCNRKRLDAPPRAYSLGGRPAPSTLLDTGTRV
jgi:hypothetical protein